MLVGIVDYFKAQRENLKRMLRFEPFAVFFPIVDALYRRSIKLMPKDKSPVFGQFLLICHKSFLTAASLVGQAQPDDSIPVTRRAIEAVRWSAAFKENPANAHKWVAFEERMKRWKDRREGKKPKPLRISLEVKHPLVKELMETWGILSDAAVHFTPEYFDSLDWKKDEDAIFLNYFVRDQHIIEREIILLAAIHAKILRVLDWCLDGTFGKDEDWRRLMAAGHEKGKPYVAKFEHAEGENGGDEPNGDGDG